LAAQQEAKQSSGEQESKRATPGQQSEQRLGLVGAWLSRELAPLERERQTMSLGFEVELGYVSGFFAGEDAAPSDAPSERRQYHVRWEVHEDEVLSDEQVLDAQIPVNPQTGRPIVCRVDCATGDRRDGCDRKGEFGIVVGCRPSNLSMDLRFLAELTPDGDVTRDVIRVNRFARSKPPRAQNFAYFDLRGKPPADAPLRDFLVELFTDRARSDAILRNPEAAELVNLLATPALLTDEAAQRFVGHRVRMLFEDTAGEMKLFQGMVRGHARDAMGRVRFDLLFDDEESYDVSTVTLAEVLRWEDVATARRVTQTADAPGSPRARGRTSDVERGAGGPRPPARAASPMEAASSPPRRSTAAGTPAASTPRARRGEEEVMADLLQFERRAQRGGSSARLSSMAARGITPAQAAAERSRTRHCSPSRPPPEARVISATAQQRRRAGDAREAARSVTQRRRGGLRDQSAAYAPKQDAALYREMRMQVMEGQDVRTTATYQRLHPLRVRSVGATESWLDSRFGVATRPTRKYKPRFEKVSREHTDRWRRVVQRMSSVKESTMNSYRSTQRGYEDCCASWEPAMQAYPVTSEAVGMWFGRRYEERRKSNINNLKPLVSALSHKCRKELGLYTDVHPYPGIDPIQREEINRICVGFAELEDMAARRSIPLTALLMRMYLGEEAVAPKKYYDGMTAAEMRELRDVTRYNLCRLGMLRKDDALGAKLLCGHFESVDGNHGRLLVEPGKANTSHVYVEVPGLGKEGEQGGWKDWISAGFCVHQWIRCLRHLHHLGDEEPLPAGAQLFPAITNGGRLRAAEASHEAFRDQIRLWTASVGFPEEFWSRVTLHGFRSGGCSDAVNSGRCTDREIKRQGRWASACFEMYIHMRADLVRDTFLAVTNRAAMVSSELSAADTASQADTMRRWQEASLAEIAEGTRGDARAGHARGERR
jgi:hypothetical protein